MSRNYQLGSRDMEIAARFALNNQVHHGTLSYASAADISSRFNLFADWARQHNARYLEYITPELVKEYGQTLAQQVKDETISPAYAQNRISAINTVMNLATKGHWKSVKPRKDCGIPSRHHIRTQAPELDRSPLNQALTQLQEHSPHSAAVIELCREFGLRSKEASLLDAKTALQQALTQNHIALSAGTKGGRYRTVPLTTDRQLDTLKRAADHQAGSRSMIPDHKSWKTWRNTELRHARNTLKQHSGEKIRDLRAAYACERYQHLTQQPAPVITGHLNTDKASNQKARHIIARELGHKRIDVTNSYLGGNR